MSSSSYTQVNGRAAAQLFQVATEHYCKSIIEALRAITPENFSIDLYVSIRTGVRGQPVITVKPQALFKGSHNTEDTT